MAFAAVAGILAWIKTKALQKLRGAAGVVLAVVIGLTVTVGGLVWLKRSIETGAIAGRDVTWLKKLAAANSEAAKQEKLLRDAASRAVNAERQKVAAQRTVVAISDRVRDLEAELAKIKGDDNPDGPIVFPKNIARSLRR